MEKSENQTIKDLLEKTQISSLMGIKEQKEVITVKSNATLQSVIKILSEAEILSVPVVDKEESGEYLGFVDVMDILTYMLKTYSESESGKKDPDDKTFQWSDWCRDIDTLTHRGAIFGITPVSTIINMSKSDKWSPVYDSGTLYQLMEVFVKGIHRVPIMNDNKILKGLISQSDILGFLMLNMHSYVDTIGSKTISELGLDKKQVITMSANAQIIHAFYLMYYNHVSAVAIVDKNNYLLANLSASDLRGFGGDEKKFSSLLMTIREFFVKVRFNRATPLTVTQKEKLSQVIVKMTFNRVHRVWVVNEKNEPISVVSIQDILSQFIDE